MPRKAGQRVISHETIYRFINAQMKRTNNAAWRRYLPRGKLKRGWRNKGGGMPRFKDHRSIHDRPPDVDRRASVGDWEADAILFSRPGQAILVAHERCSRLTLAMQATSLKADPTAATLTRLLHPVPPGLRRTMTFDNGTEFAKHHTLRDQLGLDTFFCDPRSPWQKGGIENAIARLPKTTAAQNRSRQLARQGPRRNPRTLQQHAPKMPGLPNPHRSVPSIVALQM